MLDAKYTITIRFVAAVQAKQEIHSKRAIQFHVTHRYPQNQKIHALLRPADRSRYARCDKDIQFAHVLKITLAARRSVAHNVCLATIVRKIEHAYENDVKIHVRMHAAQTQNATWSHIQHFVIVCPDLEVMHLLDALRLALEFPEEIMLIPVHRHRAAKIHNVLQKMVEPDAHAFRHISATRTEPAADLNAFITLIARVEWRAFVNIAEIRVRAFVAITLNAKSLIMCQSVHAFEITKAIHSRDADHYQNNVSIELTVCGCKFIYVHFN